MPSSISHYHPESTGLGLFVDYIKTKKGGPFSPVKRSFRINPQNDHPLKTIQPNDFGVSHDFEKEKSASSMNLESIGKEGSKVVKFITPIKSVPSIDKEFDLNSSNIIDITGSPPYAHKQSPGVQKQLTDDIQDLCSFFQSTLKVDDSSLKVEATNMTRTSPMPKEGRYTTMIPNPVQYGNGLYIAVKRSVRSINEKCHT
jgi:hypothetical protein